jgi:2-dehydro-3-deoxyphosphogluconate aldolase/(4S)-4-hydroxy-2-oxoglutarate aldolase
MEINFYEYMAKQKIVPVIKINDPKRAVGMAHALLAGGLSSAEITFRSAAAEESIRILTKEVPELLVCAGTVLNVETAQKAVQVGAKGIISPGTNPEVVQWCLANHVPVIPGCMTPTEIETNMRLGLKAVKFFPAEPAGGVKMLKAFSGPYAGVQFMPTGGINLTNVNSFLKLSNVFCCGGSWIVPEKELDRGNFALIQENARLAVEQTSC